MFKVTKATGAYAALVSVVSGTIMWFNFRPLGIFFCSALAMFWARQYAHLRLQISPLFEEKLRNGARRALDLRAARPGLFCGLISALLVLAAVIGHVVSAPYIVVTLLVLSIVISTKYDIKIVADHREPVPSACLLDQEVAEFLPEITEANASLLKQVGEDADVSAVYKPDSATISERTGGGDGAAAEDDDDDTYSDLLMPQNSIRELEEAEEDRSSTSSSDELLLGGSEPVMQAVVPAESSGEIRFKSSHFNANTSSDSDDSISRGLSFDDVPDRGVAKRKSHHHQQQQQQHQQFQQQQYEQVRPQQQDQLVALAGNLLTSGNLLSYLTTAVTAAAMSQSQPGPASSHAYGARQQQPPNRMTVSSSAGGSRRSYAEAGDDSTDEDGDSDFEMLNPDELNNV
uniref:Protein with signal anchor n=1 Tax=Culex tarsalis TaxID=7177 RepID=A0A1Q3FCH7_CULTA